MHRKPQHHLIQSNPTQCCFTQFFSPNSSQNFIKKNASGLISPYGGQTFGIYENELVFPPKKLKTQFHGFKRSISSMKANRRTSNRVSYETDDNRYARKQESIVENMKSPLRGSEVAQRYFSPKPQVSTNFSRSQLEDKRTINAYINAQNIQKKIQHVPGKPHPFFKKEKVNQPIQFTRSLKQSNLEQTHTGTQNAYTDFNRVKADKIQNFNKNVLLNFYSVRNPSTITQKERYLQLKKVESSIEILTPQTQQKPNPQSQFFQSISKRQNPFNLNVNSIYLKLKEPKSHKQSFQVHSLSALEKICEMSKEESRHQAFLETPVNPFQHIESFIMDVKREKGQQDEDEKQFDSIKTKGRPVESMLQMTKDLTKTRKNKKQSNKRQEKGLNELENMTVTSEFDEDSDDDGRERIEESAVLMNFFNPPTYLKDRLELSRANKQALQEKSGFH